MEKRRFERIIALDAHIKGTRRFWNLLVTNCCIDCCGLDALELSVERILWAGQKVGVQQLVGQLEDAIHYMENSNLTMVQSRDILCSGGTKEKFILLFRRVQHVLLGVYVGNQNVALVN